MYFNLDFNLFPCSPFHFESFKLPNLTSDDLHKLQSTLTITPSHTVPASPTSKARDHVFLVILGFNTSFCFRHRLSGSGEREVYVFSFDFLWLSGRCASPKNGPRRDKTHSRPSTIPFMMAKSTQSEINIIQASRSVMDRPKEAGGPRRLGMC